MASSNEICIDCTAQLAPNALAAATDEVKRIEAKYSRYRADSVVSQVNAAAGGEPLAVDAETAQLLAYAEACYEASDGRFDITSGVLRRAWRFDSGVLPTPAAIDALLPLIAWRRVELTQHADYAHIRLPRSGMEIDFGGFGKEYAADRAATILLQHGVSSGYVNLAGDIAVVGPQAAENVGAAWRIGIAHPRPDANMSWGGRHDSVLSEASAPLLATLELATGGLATSGDYERFMVVGGARYCHILDPRTGWPVSGLASVSVVAPSALIAGSLSTIAMLKGTSGLAWLREQGATFLAMIASGEIVRGP
jgi:thiamine biosynthesis lipoprotein